ncbi:Serine/threonine-protein kinase PknB [Planctomycetes bacterium CA13]|uniref:non-specific serine/threonine protein kinase n=1 Tax=Novipirellula herctigrandis TaxID=2527986 RepID=A0A5C5Z543_9BACT|nr:Serine/threonine-protein kinase PknB [Planctomycetes bacterium CA13]
MTSPEFLGPYRIGETLGRGGMGAVYAGVHERTGEKVAVKLISQHIADEPRFRRRFAGEVEMLKRLRHKGIVRLIGYGEQQGQLFYSMERIDGESIQQRIRREKKLDWQTTIDLSIQICEALKHAHDIGVIHRDLKPANLLLTPDHSVKLVDFGIAKLFGFGEQTMAGSVLGTADYMAPEQADGEGITIRTDLYALGSVMYAMLSGKPPFTGKNVTQVIKALRNDRVIPLDRLDPELPEALVELVHQLLEKDPAKRPPTALSVTNRLKAMRAGLLHQETVHRGDSPTSSHPKNSRGNENDQASVEKSAGADQEVTPIAANVPGQDQSDLHSRPTSKTLATVKLGSTEAGGRTDGGSSEDNAGEPGEPGERKTHFQSVESDKHIRTEPTSDKETAAERWKQAISISMMSAVLIACLVLFVKATKQPSADDLYRAVVQKNKADQVQQAQTEIDQFLRRFPDDSRFEEIKQLNFALELTRTLRRLTVQNKLGITPLNAAEQGFLDAMTGREQDPISASERLKQWLAIYDADTIASSEELDAMVVLAKNEIIQLVERSPEILIDPRATELIERIIDTIEKAPLESARDTLQGIVQLHEGEAWATPAVEEARRQLRNLDETNADSN